MAEVHPECAALPSDSAVMACAAMQPTTAAQPSVVKPEDRGTAPGAAVLDQAGADERDAGFGDGRVAYRRYVG